MDDGGSGVPSRSSVNLVSCRRCGLGVQGLASLCHRAQRRALHSPQAAEEKMEQLDGALQSAEAGQDLGSSRGLQRRHGQLGSESQALAGKMAVLVSQARQGLTSQTIVEKTQKCLQRYPPACSIFTPLCATPHHVNMRTVSPREPSSGIHRT